MKKVAVARCTHIKKKVYNFAAAISLYNVSAYFQKQNMVS